MLLFLCLEEIVALLCTSQRSPVCDMICFANKKLSTFPTTIIKFHYAFLIPLQMCLKYLGKQFLTASPERPKSLTNSEEVTSEVFLPVKIALPPIYPP